MYRSRSCILASAVALSLVLAACGTAPGDRAISGGGIGSAAGAVVGAVTGLSVLQGALIGTGLGAAFGGLTDPGAVNLGEPIWKRYSTSPGTQSSGGAKTSNMVAATQANLTRLGYRPGPVDGLYGPKRVTRFGNISATTACPSTASFRAKLP